MDNSNQRRGNSIIQIIVILLLIVLSLFVFVPRCDSDKNTNSESQEQEPSRDCRQEYNQLSQEKYNSIKEARDAARSFLLDFNIEEQCFECCDEIRKMEDEFVNMDNLFSNVDNSAPKNRYCAYIKMVESNDNVFSRSSYEAVRKTWDYLKDEKKDYYLKARLNLINENDFKPYLIAFAKDLAISRYGGRGMVVVDKGCYILNVDLEDIYQVEGKAAKRGVCTVHIEMKGGLVGWRKGYVEYRVEGQLYISPSECNVRFSKGHHELTATSGACAR